MKAEQMVAEVMFWLLYVNHMFIELLLYFVGGKENPVLPPDWNREERKDSQCWTLWGHRSVHQVSALLIMESKVGSKKKNIQRQA